MKKALAFLLSLALLCTATLALASEGVVINEKFNMEEMLNTKGETIKFTPENLVGDVELGFFFEVPEAYNGRDWSSPFMIDFTPGSMGYVYLPETVSDLHKKLVDTPFDSPDYPTEEEYYAIQDQIMAASVFLFGVIRINPAKPDSNEVEQYVRNAHKNLELITKNGDDEIFLFYNDNFDNTQMTEEEKVKIAKLVEEGKGWIANTLMVFPPENYYDVFGYSSEEIPLDGGPEAFNALDMEGNQFNAVEEFGKYELTLVNIWSTGCNPCIEEMPSLQELSEALPSNINFISVCLDTDKEFDLAAAILESAGATFTTLQGDQLATGVLKNVSATPTTLFINSAGNQVGEAILGAMASLDKFVEQSMEIINERLAMMGN